jgi:hypothetical protein
LVAGPRQITEFRDKSATSLAVARGYEIAVLIVAVARFIPDIG